MCRQHNINIISITELDLKYLKKKITVNRNFATPHKYHFRMVVANM